MYIYILEFEGKYVYIYVFMCIYVYVYTLQATLPPLVASKFRKILYMEGEYIHKYVGTLYMHKIRICFFYIYVWVSFFGHFSYINRPLLRGSFNAYI